jgi:tocopherol O-methyltransferase
VAVAGEAEIASAQRHLTGKLDAIIEKYGPGPRVHYHIGLFSSGHLGTTGLSELRLRERITAAQEDLVRGSATVWEAQTTLSGEILDIGAGLGGGSIFWAQEHGAQVHAVTNVAAHIPVIESFAAQAGVTDQVRPILANAQDLPDGLRVDGAVAMESMCYMPREAVFSALAQAVRPGGSLCIQDVFLNHPAWRTDFDAYWKTTIGTVDEYTRAAARAGFTLDRNEDVTETTAPFWLQSMAWAEHRIAACSPDDAEHRRLAESVRWHGNFYRAWRDNAIHVKFLRFRRNGTAAR